MSEAPDRDVQRLRAHFVSSAGAPPGGCPERDRLWDAARGEVDEAERDALLDHTVGCSACAEAWHLARAVILEAGIAATAPRPAPRGAPRWGYAAAALLAAAGLVIAVTMIGRREAPPAWRDDGAVSIRSLLPEGKPVLRGDLVLRWSPGPPGSLYDVEVATPDLRVVHRARGIEATELRLPEAALASVPPGGRLLWRVEAAPPDGSRLASPTFQLDLR